MKHPLNWSKKAASPWVPTIAWDFEPVDDTCMWWRCGYSARPAPIVMVFDGLGRRKAAVRHSGFGPKCLGCSIDRPTKYLNRCPLRPQPMPCHHRLLQRRVIS